MVFEKIRAAWKKRAIHHLIKNAGKEDWCTFVKALCGSWERCRGFPYDCKCCFDGYFNTAEVLQHILEK
jgi:hypothetical protein